MLNDDERAAYVAAQAKRKGRMPADDEMMFAAGIAYAQTWRSMESAPRTKRQLILLRMPGPDRIPQVAYSDTFWRAGYSVECTPTGWLPLPPTEAK